MLVYNKEINGFWYTLQDEKGKGKSKGKESPFKVQLKLLQAKDLAELQDSLITRTSSEVKNNYGSYMVNACLKGIIGWDNITNPDGSAISIDRTPNGTITIDCLNMIPYKMIEEIGTVIVSVSENPSNISIFSDK